MVSDRIYHILKPLQHRAQIVYSTGCVKAAWHWLTCTNLIHVHLNELNVPHSVRRYQHDVFLGPTGSITNDSEA